MRHLLHSYSMPNLISNIFKVLNGEIDKKEYKNKHKLFQKRAKDCSIQTLLCTYKNENNSSILFYFSFLYVYGSVNLDLHGSVNLFPTLKVIMILTSSSTIEDEHFVFRI